MPIRRTCAVAWVLCCAILPASVAGQTPSVLAEAKGAYENFDFAQARTILVAFIAEPARAATTDLAQAHLLLGVIEYTENKIEAARSRFVSALQLQPGIRPDAATVSPKIVEFFEGLISTPDTSQGEAEIRYVTLVDERPGAALRSMLLPGWGQMHKGDRTKGVALASAWVATAGATAFMHVSRAGARERYIDETDPELVAERYDAFNRRHRIRNAVALSAAGVWLVAYVDALATPGRSTIRPISLSASPTIDGATFSAVIRFGNGRK